MLPFLKKRHEGGASYDVSIKRSTDEDTEGYEMLDAICEDMMEAVQKKDKALLKGCLEALVEHIQMQDEISDHEMMEQ